jgi:hypothetical protein
LDINKNKQGKWNISKQQMAKGNDVFRVNSGNNKTATYTFSQGDYGKRIDMLNLENNENYTLGVYHISGAKEGGTGFAVTPGGAPSTQVNSYKRLPPDFYTLGQGYNKWRQPMVMRGEENGDVSGRYVKFHLGYSYPISWTKGCFVISSDYVKEGNTIKYNQKESRQALREFDRNLGARRIYNFKKKGVGYTLIGADFGKEILDYKLILQDAF